MNPELWSAVYSLGSALVGAGAVWLKMRRGGSPEVPVVPPVRPPVPGTGRPVVDLLLKLWAEREAKRQAEQEALDARELAALLDNHMAAQRAGKE
jgi:hypothetical protein